jgi:NADP-dependent 3-hydroxy acid dehydrogenase YdfG
VPTIAADATDAALMDRIVVEKKPDVLILDAGAWLPMKPIDEQNWEEFSAAWTTDVRAGRAGIQAVLKAPMRSGGRVLVMSSGGVWRRHTARVAGRRRASDLAPPH